jgi:hypothetical protein
LAATQSGEIQLPERAGDEKMTVEEAIIEFIKKITKKRIKDILKTAVFSSNFFNGKGDPFKEFVISTDQKRAVLRKNKKTGKITAIYAPINKNYIEDAKVICKELMPVAEFIFKYNLKI